jgi:hypothetical protein
MRTDMRILEQILYRGFSPYYFARKFLYNLRNFSDHSKRKKYSALVDESALAAIRHDGWHFMNSDRTDIAMAVDYCRNLEERLYPSSNPPQTKAAKDFWTLLVDRSNIKEHPTLIAFGSQAVFKDMASVYLGEEAVLSEITLMKSFATHKAAKHSQLWHLDGDDDKLLLFYVYCRDVDDEAGPFMLIPKSRQPPNFLPRFFRKYGNSDADVNADSSAVAVVGDAGTVFACDTATTYHCGSRCKSKTRLALSIRYTTRSGLYPVVPLA